VLAGYARRERALAVAHELAGIDRVRALDDANVGIEHLEQRVRRGAHVGHDLQVPPDDARRIVHARQPKLRGERYAEAGSSSTFVQPDLRASNALYASTADMISPRLVSTWSGSTVPFAASATRSGM